MSRKNSQFGFTLIEAIVALVLVGSVGMALFSWINTNIITLNRVQEINAQSEATRNIIEYMNAINPMIRPEGKVDFGSCQVTWQAEISTDMQDGANYPRGVGFYQLAMYRTNIDVKKSSGEPWFGLTLQQVGYKKIRDLKVAF